MATATGTFSALVPEGYRREGDVIELYVYSAPAPGYPQGFQLGRLGGEHPPPVDGGPGTTWAASVALDSSFGVPANCVVDVQPTHQFEGAGNDY